MNALNSFVVDIPTCELCERPIHGSPFRPSRSFDTYHYGCWKQMQQPTFSTGKSLPAAPVAPALEVAPVVELAPAAPVVPVVELVPLMPAPLPPDGRRQVGWHPRRSPPPPLPPPPPRPKPPTLADRVVEALQICPLDGSLLRVVLGTKPPPTSIKPGFGYQLTNGWYHLPGQAIPDSPPRQNAVTIEAAIAWLDYQDPDTARWRLTTIRELAEQLGITRVPATKIIDQIGEEMKKRRGKSVLYRLRPGLRRSK